VKAPRTIASQLTVAEKPARIEVDGRRARATFGRAPRVANAVKEFSRPLGRRDLITQ
jgi:hypothetical protein